MRNRTIINEANKILISLQKLQEKCNNLVLKANNGDCLLPEYIIDLLSVLDDLGSFDLEDAIVHAYDCQDIIEENLKNGIHVHILKRK